MKNLNHSNAWLLCNRKLKKPNQSLKYWPVLLTHKIPGNMGKMRFWNKLKWKRQGNVWSFSKKAIKVKLGPLFWYKQMQTSKKDPCSSMSPYANFPQLTVWLMKKNADPNLRFHCIFLGPKAINLCCISQICTYFSILSTNLYVGLQFKCSKG